MIPPRIALEDEPAPRLLAELPSVVQEPRQPWGTAALMLAGALVLVLGLAGITAGNLIADQFARAPWLGCLSLVVAGLGFGLVGVAVWRELRALWALGRVDRLRQDFASGDAARIMEAAHAWAVRIPGGPALLPALRAVNDPDAAIALLRAGPGQALRDAADAQGRAAAVQMVAGIAAMPSPALDVLLVGWRGVRLVRQVAALYGVRPGLLGTLALLRRTALAATMVGAAEIMGNTAAHALLSSPLLAHALGEAAGAGVAARRMLVLGRAAVTACDPLP